MIRKIFDIFASVVGGWLLVVDVQVLISSVSNSAPMFHAVLRVVGDLLLLYLANQWAKAHLSALEKKDS